MDSYHIYSVIKYKFECVTDERTSLGVDRQGQLHYTLPSLDQL
jgi:hypothetical protein